MLLAEMEWNIIEAASRYSDVLIVTVNHRSSDNNLSQCDKVSTSPTAGPAQSVKSHSPQEQL